MVEASLLAREGLDKSLSHELFVHRYHPLLFGRGVVPPSHPLRDCYLLGRLSLSEQVQTVLTHCSCSCSLYRIGPTRIFLTDSLLSRLENLRSEVVKSSAKALERHVLAWQCRRRTGPAAVKQEDAPSSSSSSNSSSFSRASLLVRDLAEGTADRVCSTSLRVTISECGGCGQVEAAIGPAEGLVGRVEEQVTLTVRGQFVNVCSWTRQE